MKIHTVELRNVRQIRRLCLDLSAPLTVVGGPNGVGKSTLVTLLANHLGWQPVLEAVTENPYLPDFYTDMQRWAFHSQIYFLGRRLQQHHDLLQALYSAPTPIIQDRSVYEDAKASDWLAGRTGIRAVVMPHTVGSVPGADDLFSMFDVVVNTLKEAQQ